jgi:CRP/FNR family transcriptional regulator, cyclic AMP receptor protein
MAHAACLQKLTEQELGRLDTISRHHKFSRDHVVFFEGSRSDSLYVIVRGAVKIYRNAQDGREKILSVLGSGEIFGEFSLLDGQPRSASVATLQPSEMLSIDHLDFRRFIMNSPDVLWKVLEEMCERLRIVNDENFDLAFRSMAYRFVRALLKLGEYRTASVDGVKVIVSKQDLAGMVGCSAERLSSLLQKLEDRNLVRTRGNDVHICDIDVLRKAIEFVEDL